MKTNIDCWTELLANLSESYKKWFEEEKKYLQKTITCNANVLDVGCGYSAFFSIKRVLKKSGKLVISTYSEDAFEERMKGYKASGVNIREVKEGTVIFNESLGDNISEQFTKRQLEDIFFQANLQIKDITKTGISYLCKLTK